MDDETPDGAGEPAERDALPGVLLVPASAATEVPESSVAVVTATTGKTDLVHFFIWVPVSRWIATGLPAVGAVSLLASS